MTLHAVTIPKWGLAMEEGTLTSWLVAEGADIMPGLEIVEIETSKITNVLEAQMTGTLRRRVVSEGEVKPVGALIGVVTDADEDESSIDAFVAQFEARFASEEASGPSAPIAETIVIEGETSRFLVVDESDGADRAPAVLIHGFGGDLHNWMFNQSAWAKNRPTYAIELPGHGQSSKTVGAGTLVSLAHRVIAFLDAKGLDRVHLVGHSMGAGVALTVASLAPDRARSVSAIAGMGFGGRVSPEYVEGFIAAQKRKDMKPVAQMLFADADLVTREMIDDLVAYKRLDGVPDALRMLADHALTDTEAAALDDRVAALTIPLDAVFGASDQVVPTQVASDSPHAVLEAGHMVHMEKAEIVNERLAAFMAAHD